MPNMDIPDALAPQVQALLDAHQRETLAARFAVGTRVRFAPQATGEVTHVEDHDGMVCVAWDDHRGVTWEHAVELEPIAAAPVPEQREYKAGDRMVLDVIVSRRDANYSNVYCVTTVNMAEGTWPVCDSDGDDLWFRADQLRPRP